MSNVSFARIMYGIHPENPSPALMPLSNFASHGLQSSGSLERTAAYSTVENLLHKAWLLIFPGK